MVPFLEKHRPTKFDDIVGQRHIISSLQEMLKSIEEFPHCVFYGPPGIGKTTVAGALANAIYGPSWPNIVQEINASEERSLDTVRNKIIAYCRTQLPIDDVARKMVILEEADHFDVRSQPALRRPMEQFSENTIFILTCNNPRKIIPAILSRCAVFKFEEPISEEIGMYVSRVAEAEGVEIDLDAFDMLVSNSHNDYRRALMLFQPAIQLVDGVRKITAERLTDVFNFIDEDSIREAFNLLFEHKTKEAIDLLDSYLVSGVPADVIVEHLYGYCKKLDLFLEGCGIELMKVFSEVSSTISDSAIPSIVLSYLAVAIGKRLRGC